jgi:hypothetical protein
LLSPVNKTIATTIVPKVESTLLSPVNKTVATVLLSPKVQPPVLLTASVSRPSVLTSAAPFIPLVGTGLPAQVLARATPSIIQAVSHPIMPLVLDTFKSSKGKNTALQLIVAALTLIFVIIDTVSRLN